jgi:hypothetical protein
MQDSASLYATLSEGGVCAGCSMCGDVVSLRPPVLDEWSVVYAHTWISHPLQCCIF